MPHPHSKCRPKVLFLSVIGNGANAYRMPFSSIAVHCHPLRLAAELPLDRRTDGPTASLALVLQCNELLRAVGLVMDLARGLNEVLKVRAQKEVTESDKFAVRFVLHIDDAPPVLTASNVSALHDDRLFRTDDCEGDLAFDIGIQGPLLLILFVVVVRVHPEIVESKLFLDPFFECLAFL